MIDNDDMESDDEGFWALFGSVDCSIPCVLVECAEVMTLPDLPELSTLRVGGDLTVPRIGRVEVEADFSSSTATVDLNQLRQQHGNMEFPSATNIPAIATDPTLTNIPAFATD